MSECIGIDDVIRDLTIVSSSLNYKVDEMVDRLADIGLAEMQGFRNPSGFYDVNDSVVEKKTTKGAGTKILARGHQVTFIEYGAGDDTTSPSEMGFDGPNYKPGDWSMTHDQQYFRKGFWIYKNHFFKGQPSNRFAYKAQKQILEHIKTESKGLFEV